MLKLQPIYLFHIQPFGQLELESYIKMLNYVSWNGITNLIKIYIAFTAANTKVLSKS